MSRLLWFFLLLFLISLDPTEGWRRRRRRRCPRTDCSVSGWTSWRSCTASCGYSGTQYRTRTVTRGASCGGSCPYALRQNRACNRVNCPVNGGWSSWSGFSSCTKPCGSGSQERSRSCTQPPPSYGGKSCSGTELDKQLCNRQPCPVDGDWSSWSAWTTCSKPCESGMQARTRSCSQPPPQHGGKQCTGATREHRVCNTHSCPVHGAWSSWFISTPCDVTCGSGTETLSRTCTNPEPKYGGRPCLGNAQKIQTCVKEPCPIHGGWSDWSVSTPCSVTCGHGVEVFERTCTNPTPKYGGRPCQGVVKKKEACTKKPCPIHGGWSSWDAWAACTKSCESGIQARTRKCTQPPAQDGGKTCPGTALEERVCNTHACP